MLSYGHENYNFFRNTLTSDVQIATTYNLILGYIYITDF